MAESWLIALPRDEARRLFAAQDDESLWRLVAELRTTASSGQEIRQVACDATWKALEPALRARGASDAYPWDHVLRGGRLMTRDESRGHIYLKRPDNVAHVADALKRLSREEFRDQFDSQADASVPIAAHAWEDACRLLGNIRDFYVGAAREKCAAVFVVEN